MPAAFRPFGMPLDDGPEPGYAPRVPETDDIRLQEYLEGFLTQARKDRLRTVLRQRTRHIVCVLEDLYDPRNGSAVLRHCDALGIQEIHAIENLHRFKSDENVDMGTAQWLDLNVYRNDDSLPRSMKGRRRLAAASPGRTTAEPPSPTPRVLENLKKRGYRIVATSPHGDDDAVPETLDIASGPVAVVFGTEKHGISNHVRQAADVFLSIPMVGFVESFNISASAAITFHVLSRRLREEGVAWQLDEDDASEVYSRWVKKAAPHAESLIRAFRDGRASR